MPLLGVKAWEVPTEWEWGPPHGHSNTARQRVHCPALAGPGNKLQTGHLGGVCVSWCFQQQTPRTPRPVVQRPGRKEWHQVARDSPVLPLQA